MNLTDDIAYLKGVGPSRAKILASEAGIHTLADLLDYLPFRYVDRSVIATVASLREDSGFVVLKGMVNNMQTVATGKHRERLTVDLFDGSGYIQLVWFAGTKWVRERLKPNVEYIVMGHPTVFNGLWQISHPEIEPYSYVDEGARHPLMPVYTTTEKMKQSGLGTRAIARLTDALISHLSPLTSHLIEIEIDAKLAFGTGTHETTRMVCATLLDLLSSPNGGDRGGLSPRVLDCGCGTGILGITAMKLGARECVAYDIDEWSVDNTRHNAVINQVELTPLLGDSSVLNNVEGEFDIIMANINRNILLADMPAFRQKMASGARLILSGFYTADIPQLTDRATELGLSLVSQKEEADWACLLFK